MNRRDHDPFAPHEGSDTDAKPASKSRTARRKPASKSKESPMFPSTRLRSAGATDAEVAQLEAEHNTSSPAAQESRLAHLEKIAEGDIVEWLAGLREAGHFGEQKPEEPVEATDEALADEVPAQEPEDTTPKPEPEVTEETKPEDAKPKSTRKAKAAEKPEEPVEAAE